MRELDTGVAKHNLGRHLDIDLLASPLKNSNFNYILHQESYMTRLTSAFAKPHPALGCCVTAGDGDTAANLDTVRCPPLRARENDIFTVAEKLGVKI